MLDNIQRERGFAHAGAGGENREFAVLQAAGFVVVVGEAGFDAAETVLVLHARIEPRETAFDNIADAFSLRVAFGIEDAEHALFGAGEHFARIDAGFVGVLNDVGAGVDQRAKDRFISNDAGVVLGMSGRGYVLAQFEQERRAADRFILARIFEKLAQQRRIDLLAALVEREHVAEDCAVGRVVEIFRADNEGHFIARFGKQQQAADDGAFGFDAARRLAIEQFAHALGRFARGFLSTVATGSIRLVEQSGRAVER